MIGGLDTPTSGQVMVAGKEYGALKDEELTIFRRRNIGFVFQNYNLLPVLSVYENIVFPIELDGREPNRERTDDIIETLGLGEKRNRMPNQLSGGQQQRVAIARALAAEPVIVLADEPTGNLDTNTGLEVMMLLQAGNKKYHQTTVIITHNEEISQMADRIIRIEDGKIAGGN
jgi:putative ABC transport system ATP-binding protein